MEGWEFFSIKQQSALARWRWLYRAPQGAIAGESNGGFASYAECVNNALKHGYPDSYAYPPRRLRHPPGERPAASSVPVAAQMPQASRRRGNAAA